MTECYFTPSKGTTSATICANCGLEKMVHTIGEGIKVNKTIIFIDKNGASEDMWDCGWYTLGDKHYCSKCHTVNDEDELIINEDRIMDDAAKISEQETFITKL